MSKSVWIRFCLATFVTAAFLALGCDSSSPVAPQATATVVFEYSSRAQPAPLPTPESTGCAHHNQNNKLYGSWAPQFAYRDISGDCSVACTVTVPDVPVNQEHVVWFVDLAYCNEDPIPATLEAYEELHANGVQLQRVVDHPSGARGAALTVDRQGMVTP